MDNKSTSKGIIYNFFKYSKDNNGKEQGLLNISYICPVEGDANNGWKSYSTWLPFSDELYKYLKGTLIKQSELEFSFREDYRNSNTFIREITKINDFVIKR